MEWWQIGTGLEWWQTVLILLSSVAVGLAVFALTIYIISRFEKNRETTKIVEQQLISIAPDLVAEIEENLRISTKYWTRELLPFQTQVWDAIQDEVHSLPINLRENLTLAYLDIHHANSVVRLSTELSHRSQNLDEIYSKWCTDIAARLSRITPLAERSSLKRVKCFSISSAIVKRLGQLRAWTRRERGNF